jgi:hypothetical protein
MFASLRYLPLADAVAIAFVMPFIMLLLGWFYLGEEVGPRRFGACIVGFIGTLMVVQPSFAEVGWPALLPLAWRSSSPSSCWSPAGSRGKPTPWHCRGRRRSLRFPFFCRWRFCRSQPTCPSWAGSRRGAGMSALFVLARCDRGRGASLHDVVAAFCALGDAGPDAVSRDPHRDARRPDDLRRSAQRPWPRSASS